MTTSIHCILGSNWSNRVTHRKMTRTAPYIEIQSWVPYKLYFYRIYNSIGYLIAKTCTFFFSAT